MSRKTKLSDIDEMLAKSQRLTSHLGDYGSRSRSVNRGAGELFLASKALSQTITEQSSLDAYRLLSQHNFDAKKLFEDMSDESVARLEGTDIEGYLAHHHDMIILAAIDEARRGAENDAQELQRRWAATEWLDAKSRFMESVGHRSSAAARLNETNALTVYTPAAGKTVERSMLTPYKGFPTSAADSFADSVQKSTRQLYKLSELLTKHHSVVRALNLSTHYRTSASAASGMHSMTLPMMKPCTVLASAISAMDVQAGVSDGLSKGDMVGYRALVELLSCIVGENDMVMASDRSGAGPVSAGAFSAICFDASEVNQNQQEEKRRLLSAGAKRYFEHQMWEIWNNKVDTAVNRGELTLLPSVEGNSRQQRLRSYVWYQSQLKYIPQASHRVPCASGSGNLFQRMGSAARSASMSEHATSAGNVSIPLWPFIYHCLRVGELQTALIELNECVNCGYREGEHDAYTVLKLLEPLIHHHSTLSAAGGGKGSSGSGAHGTLAEKDIKTLQECMSHCRAYYEQEAKKDDSANDPYRLLVFNLLSLADRDGLGVAIHGFNLEDFLWAQLWFIQISRIAGEKASSAPYSSEVFVGSKYHRAVRERDFFELTQEYGGADYFDEDRTTPYRYAMVLFCCQRYGDAIAHLWQANQSLPAMHLAIICLYYGLILPYVPLTQNPAHPLVNAKAMSHHSAASEVTPSSMIQIFTSHTNLTHYPEYCTDYVFSLDTNWLAHVTGLSPDLKEKCKLESQRVVSDVLEAFLLSLDREKLVTVVGQPVTAEDGVRGQVRTAGSRIDDYLDAGHVEFLLSRIAYHLLTQRKEHEAAIYFYQLAGKYEEMLHELCRQLSLYLIPDNATSGQGAAAGQQADGQRSKWVALGESFIRTYLQPSATRQHGQSLIFHRLIQSRNTELLDTLQILVMMYKVMDAYAKDQFGSVLEMMDSMSLLPVSAEGQMDIQTAMRPYISTVLDDLLVIVMDCTKNLFKQVKEERQLLTATGKAVNILTDKDIQMQMLKKRGQALVKFANMVKPKLKKETTANNLARMESLLM